MRQHLRSFEDALAYPPNQVFIGNRTPESLWDVPEPWWGYREPNANPRGPFGQIVSE
ncbi:MAG: glycine reductase, partial [Chloroflexi bacterium]